MLLLRTYLQWKGDGGYVNAFGEGPDFSGWIAATTRIIDSELTANILFHEMFSYAWNGLKAPPDKLFFSLDVSLRGIRDGCIQTATAGVWITYIFASLRILPNLQSYIKRVIFESNSLFIIVHKYETEV